MGLNVDNPEAYALALEISRRTGESLEDAVLRALRELNARLVLEAPQRPRSSPEEIRCRWAEIEAQYPQIGPSDDPGDGLLYDERGLPHGR